MEKYQHMRAFISAALDYTKHPSESATSAIQRSLGVISVSLDLNVFDPGTSIAAEFYVSLYELMNSVGSRSTLIWSAVDVLQNVCRNVPARQSLIHTYKFTPILARLLEANVTSEKRIRVLKLLQELTYGIKISWQEVYLSYLISTLTQWVVQSKEEEIIALSLGVLVNLCYKNLPAVYTLMRTIDTKAFIRTLLKLQEHVNTSVQCCKLLIILEPTNTNISEKYIMDFASITFTNLKTAMEQKNVFLLRHIVDFFNDVVQNEHSRNILLTYSNYDRDVKNILATLEENTDPECIAVMMEFLLSLVKLKLCVLIPLYPICIKSAMTWVPVEQVCSKALALIRNIIIDSRRTKTCAEVLTEVDPSVLMLITNPEDEINEQNGSQNAEMETKQAELMQLFQEMIKTPAFKKKIMQSFSEHVMRRIFIRVLDNEFSAAGDWTGNFVQNASINLYIYALALTADLATSHSNWLTLYSELLSRKQIQMILALALFTGDEEVKQKVLQLTSSTGFPQECISAVAVCMKELEPLMLIQSNNNVLEVTNKSSLNYTGNELAPLFSVTQEERLDACLAKLKSAFESNQINDIATSAVMELYEYKLAAMRHSERAMQSSLEAANNHGTSLQHRLAQVVAESSRLHQLLFDTQQCLEGIRAEKSVLTRTLHEKEEQSKKAIFVKKQEIESLRKIVTEKSANLEHLNKKLIQCTNELEASKSKINILNKKIQELDNERLTAEKKATDINNKNHELSKHLQNIKDSLSKKEQILEKKNAEIEINQSNISALKQEIQQMVQMLQTHEQTILEKEKDNQRMKAELTDLSRMRDMIFELTAKNKDDLNTS
ncbi:Protein KIAA1524-like protein [Camponotus floridanus]|uniref:Protein KIAA1524-like protein n=1 Tax=Camponotus floridanus TaxID=104421 RepID=E1ZYY9_CAMFO|nr:ELKS/Rab6-interacting/CAST family member 1 [Camponotus floridanus]EFN73679.1 Protein KIAA1524-like protein [Camponotus floridanus]